MTILNHYTDCVGFLNNPAIIKEHSLDSNNIIKSHFQQHIETMQQTLGSLENRIADAGLLIAHRYQANRKLLICGNGGSASDAQHFSSELVNRLEKDRAPLASIALTTDASNLTSIANDYSYDQIFSKQILALGNPGDLLVAITTSGNSTNILTAIEAAHQKQMQVLALTGRNGGLVAQMLNENDLEIRIPSQRTMRIQEAHITIIHCLCDIAECHLFPELQTRESESTV